MEFKPEIKVLITWSSAPATRKPVRAATKMAEANGVSSEQDSGSVAANSGSIHHSYEALKGLSRKAILEFEELQQKYNECYKKYTEEQAKLLKAKADLDKLKEVSSLALSEYENLHYNYEVEQDCRDKAEEFATQMMKENKNLKRKSQLIMEQGGSSFLEVPTDNLQGESEDKNTESDKNVYKEQIKELKGVVVSLRKELADTQAKLSSIQEELEGEREGHQSTRRKLFMSDKQFKQLNRVSAMAMEEFSVLQLKFQVEAECRNKAEKYAAEVVREKDALDHLTDSFRKDEGLADALKEIANMHKKFADERAEYEAKIKELSEEIKEATDSEFVEGLREKLHVAHEHIDTLGQQLEDAQQRATKAEEQVSELKQNLEDAKKAATVPPPPPPPVAPPPPPPPPPPHQLIKKFIRIVGSKKKRSQSESAPSDPLKDAMKEMMDRIKSGNVQLRPVQTPQSGKDNEDADGSAMKELGNILSQNKLRKSTTTGDRSGNLLSPVEESECEWANIKLRKRADGGSGNKGTLPANWDSSNGELNRVVLRKPRSRSEGDLLREDNESSNELKKILQKQKQEADKGEIVG